MSTGGFRVFALLGLAYGLTGCPGGGDTVVKMDVEEHELSNGLKVLLVEDHTIPLISYQTWFKVGSVDEKPGITGISHYFEHLMFKGTKSQGPKAFFDQLESKGAEVNAYTTRDYTVYYENFTPNLLETAMKLESDRMVNLELTEEKLETERKVVLEERRLRTDNSPAGQMREVLWNLSYIVHPYKWPVIGYPQDVASIKLEDLNRFYKKYYHPGNATLVIAGDIDPDRTMELVEKYYGGIEERDRPGRDIPSEPPQTAERRYRLVDEVASQRFVQGYHVTAAEQEDTYALDVLANILFSGTSSRAYRELVEKKELTLGVSGHAYTPTYPGLFMVQGTMKGDLDTLKAEKALDAVIRDVHENGVSDEEVRVAVKQLMVDLVDSVQTVQGLARMIGTAHIILGDAEQFARDLRKYGEVTPEDVKRVARKYLTPNNRTTVVMVPPSKAEGRVF